jgi:pyruvate formate lyase activating enzyme
LDYVYVGNVSGEDLNTYCPNCKALILKRAEGIIVEHLNPDQMQCSKCGKEINIIGLD